MSKAQLRALQEIPGIGPAGAQDLWELGFQQVRDLRDADPEAMYAEHCLQKDQKVDRCVLYVFRCAVYYASHNEHDPELLKWWNWRD